jgi:hypothetical protein
MSRELREKADIVMKELREILLPLSDEISRMKNRERDFGEDR